MAKKTDEKDVLIVRDEKTGEISVVAGLNADGSPKRTPAKAENARSFLQFDRHGDVLDNFFKNFFHLTTSFSTPSIWNYTISTKFITTINNINPCTYFRISIIFNVFKHNITI